jgi:hypothetical protein
MTHDDLDLAVAARLIALEARAPGRDDPPPLARRARRGRFALSLTMAPVLALVLVATTVAGTVIVANRVRVAPGVQNPGQPLEGAELECMTPRAAEAFLASRGFTNVVWQVESGDASSKTGSRSVQQSSPPEHGYVVPGSILDGVLYMVVDQRVGATGSGRCFGDPMP